MAKPQVSDDTIIGGPKAPLSSVRRAEIMEAYRNNKNGFVRNKAGDPIRPAGDWERVDRAKRTDFSKKSLVGVDFEGEDITGVIFRDCEFENCTYRKADCRWCDFTGSKGLESCDFEGANLLEAIASSGRVIDGRDIKHPWQ